MSASDAPLPDGHPDGDARDARTYESVGNTLLGGLLVSIAVMAMGLVDLAIQGGQGATQVIPLDQILPALLEGYAPAPLDLGILLLFATPLLGVVVALVNFIRERDGAFTGISAVLLVILVVGFAIALR